MLVGTESKLDSKYIFWMCALVTNGSVCNLDFGKSTSIHPSSHSPLQIQNIQLEREMALASNRSLAEQNLDMKPRLESQKEVLVERYCQLEAVRDTYRQHGALRGRSRWKGGVG